MPNSGGASVSALDQFLLEFFPWRETSILSKIQGFCLLLEATPSPCCSLLIPRCLLLTEFYPCAQHWVLKMSELVRFYSGKNKEKGAHRTAG